MRSGKGHFDLTYGETADATRLMLTQCHPDLGALRHFRAPLPCLALSPEFLIAFVYGYVYSFSQVLSGTETAFIIIAALVASDAPLQLAWHMQGAKRHGVNRDQIRAVRGMAMLVASRAGVSWKGELPDFLESDVSP